MTTIILSIQLFLIVNFAFSQEQSYSLSSNFNLIKDKNKNVPHIVNNLKLPGHISKRYENKFNGIDSFPVFPGFPIEVPDFNHFLSGGIYCQIDSDKDLEIVYAIGQKIYAWNINGTNVPGWPVNILFWAFGSPAYGDINGDGVGEILVGTRDLANDSGAICAFNINGTTVTGFPIISYGFAQSVTLGDLENDGSLEIIADRIFWSQGEIRVYRGSGDLYQGWPKALNHVPGSSSSIGDITGDGIPEIVSTSALSVYVFDKNGNILPGFPFNTTKNEHISYSTPVLADIDNDSIREIVFAAQEHTNFDGNVYILKNNGTIYPGWPKHTSRVIFAPVLTVDINENNVMDIIVGTTWASPSYIYGWDKNGNDLSGFPITVDHSINIQASAGDIDNDNHVEIIVDDNSTINGIGRLLAFNGDGTPVDGWPLYFEGTSFSNFPSLADLNHDNILDIVSASTIGFAVNKITKVYVWNTGMNYNPSKIINPMWQFNSRHSGVYGDYDVIEINNPNSDIPEKFQLEQNYPNPFNPSTKINYELPITNYVTLKIYDIVGKEVATLVNEQQNAGRYSVKFDGSNFASGVYFYRIQAGDFSQVKKMFLVK